jgi:hypothetical protein
MSGEHIMFPLQDNKYLLETVEGLIEFVKSDDDPQLADVIVRLEVLGRKLRMAQSEWHSVVDEATEAEFHSLLDSHPKLQKAYLLRHIGEGRKSALSALQKLAALAQTRQLSDDEMRRLGKTEEALRKWEDFEEDIKRRYADTQ